MEKISVVIPAYNAEDTIERAVRSALDQTWTEAEVIVVDDGSKDGTSRVLERLQTETGRLRVIRQENGGVSAARNTGIQAARGRWLMTLDDDDYIDPEMFRKMLQQAETGGCDLVMCGLKLVYENRTETFAAERESVADRDSFLREQMLWLYDNHLLTTHSNKLYDMNIIRREKLLYDPSLQINEDIDFVLRYLRHCRRIGIVQEACLNYVQHRTGQSMITTFRRNAVSSSVNLVKDLQELFSGMEPGETLKNGMYNRLLVHTLSYVGIMYSRSPLSNEEKLEEIRQLNRRPVFRELLQKTRPQSLKTAAAQGLLLTGQIRLYHEICTRLYRKNRELPKAAGDGEERK